MQSIGQTGKQKVVRERERARETWILCVQRMRVCWFIRGPRIALSKIEQAT